MTWSLADHPADLLAVFRSFEPGYRLVDGGDLLTVARLLFSTQEGALGGTSLTPPTTLAHFPFAFVVHVHFQVRTFLSHFKAHRSIQRERASAGRHR